MRSNYKAARDRRGTHFMEKQFYIWSIERGSWWRPASNGYTRQLDHAGKYGEKEAFEIVRSANQFQKPFESPNEALVPAP